MFGWFVFYLFFVLRSRGPSDGVQDQPIRNDEQMEPRLDNDKMSGRKLLFFISLSRPGPWNKKFERLIFPTKYVIPKSLSRLAIGQVSYSLGHLSQGRSTPCVGDKLIQPLIGILIMGI